MSVGLGFFRGRKVHRDSTAIALDVQPLPAGAPPGFSPTNVGQWRFTASLAPANVPVGEPATLSMVVEGQGNVHGLTLPNLPVIPGLRAYDPTSTDKLQPQGDRFGGRRQVDIILIPQRTGDFELPPLKFQWYDPKVGYQEASAPSMVLHAGVGAAASAAGSSALGGQNVLEATYRALRGTSGFAGPHVCRGRPRRHWAVAGPTPGARCRALPWRWASRRRRCSCSGRCSAQKVARAALAGCAGAPRPTATGWRAPGCARTAAPRRPRSPRPCSVTSRDRLGEPMAGLSHGNLRARLLALGVEARAVELDPRRARAGRVASLPADARRPGARAREAAGHGGVCARRARALQRQGQEGEGGVTALVAMLGAAAMSAGGAGDALARAGGALAHGDYSGAAKGYAEAAALLPRCEPLEYDIGTAAAEADEVGPSVLWLERALRERPWDSDARQNLERVRQKRVDKVMGQEPGESPCSG